jgi:hypothetical protein
MHASARCPFGPVATLADSQFGVSQGPYCLPPGRIQILSSPPSRVSNDRRADVPKPPPSSVSKILHVSGSASGGGCARSHSGSSGPKRTNRHVLLDSTWHMLPSGIMPCPVLHGTMSPIAYPSSARAESVRTSVDAPIARSDAIATKATTKPRFTRPVCAWGSLRGSGHRTALSSRRGLRLPTDDA